MQGMSRFLHTMLRITDPARSRAFYEAIGMEFRRESDIVRNGELEATLTFLAFPGDQVGRSYDLGTGYGHIAIGVGDMAATLAGLAAQGIAPEKEPYRIREGGSLLCFVKDPDGYRIEIIEKKA